eukprot:gene27173-33444_t
MVYIVLAGQVNVEFADTRKEDQVLGEGEHFHMSVAQRPGRVESAAAVSDVLVLLAMMQEDRADSGNGLAGDSEEARFQQARLEQQAAQKKKLAVVTAQCKTMEVQLGIQLKFTPRKAWRILHRGIQTHAMIGMPLSGMVRPLPGLVISHTEELLNTEEAVARLSHQADLRRAQLAQLRDKWARLGRALPPMDGAQTSDQHFWSLTSDHDLSKHRLREITKWLDEVEVEMLVNIRLRRSDVTRLYARLACPSEDLEQIHNSVAAMGVTASALATYNVELDRLQGNFAPRVAKVRAELMELWDELGIEEKFRRPFLEEFGLPPDDAVLDRCQQELQSLQRMKAAVERGKEGATEAVKKNQKYVQQCIQLWTRLGPEYSSGEDQAQLMHTMLLPEGDKMLQLVVAALEDKCSKKAADDERKRQE